MLNNTKAQSLGKKVESGAVIIILVVVLFLMYAELVPEVQEAGDSLNESNRCEDVGCVYNATDNAITSADCQLNNSGVSPPCPNAIGGQGIPLSGLFSGKGIIVLLIMVALIITIIKVVLPKSKK